METIKLYSYFRSSAAYRVRIALNLKNIAYETLSVHLINEGGENWKPEYLGINPQGFVPALVDPSPIGLEQVSSEQTNKDITMFQSLAIIEYIDEKFSNPPLLPMSLPDRALCRGLAQIVCCDIHPLNNLRILKYLKDEFSCSQASVDDWYRHWIREGLKAFEAHLANRTLASDYCCSDLPSLADICLIPQLYNAKRFDLGLAEFPIISQIDQTCRELPAFQRATPEAQPDAE